jgi:hypothetical protein
MTSVNRASGRWIAERLRRVDAHVEGAEYVGLGPADARGDPGSDVAVPAVPAAIESLGSGERSSQARWGREVEELAGHKLRMLHLRHLLWS